MAPELLLTVQTRLTLKRAEQVQQWQRTLASQKSNESYSESTIPSVGYEMIAQLKPRAKLIETEKPGDSKLIFTHCEPNLLLTSAELGFGMTELRQSIAQKLRLSI